MIKRLLLIVLTPSVIATSCSTFLLKKDVRNTPTNCFNLMWQNIDEHYSFFEYKKIDWQGVKKQYQPRINDTMSQDSLFKVLGDMLFELRDGHVNLANITDRTRNWEWKDSMPDNFNHHFLFRQYFKKDYHLTGSLPNQMILPDSIGLVRYSSFSYGISDSDLDHILYRFKDCKGIILDVRDNGGGAMSNVFKIMSRFVEAKTHVGYIYLKNGKAHNAFTKPQALYAIPAKKRPTFTKPVALLINRGSYSATTHLAAFMSLFPNVTLIGDKTGGGGGIPISADLPNGWQYRFSATYQTLPDGTQFEHGVDPDIAVTTGAKEELDSKDAIIEKAIEVIKMKSGKVKGEK
jgi:hypothetical protein